MTKQDQRKVEREIVRIEARERKQRKNRLQEDKVRAMGSLAWYQGEIDSHLAELADCRVQQAVLRKSIRRMEIELEKLKG